MKQDESQGYLEPLMINWPLSGEEDAVGRGAKEIKSQTKTIAQGIIFIHLIVLKV